MEHSPSKQRQQDSLHGAILGGSSAAMNASTRGSWQNAFFEAIIETNQSRAVPLIHSAQSILGDRLAEVACEPSGYSAEMLDLGNSLTYLSILLECVGTSRGEFLWD